jgi:predicted NBD/HSP70 family sugar kinase
MNRELWLATLVDRLRPEFQASGAPLPERLHVSVGFPAKGATRTKGARIGECWPPSASADGSHQLFISPVIGDGLRAGDILVHELCHAALPPDTGHNKTFEALARKLGLAGKPTATVASSELVVRLNGLMEDLGPYPQPALRADALQRKKQSTRLLKAICEHCGYTVRVTAKWLAIGAPLCPTDETPMTVDDSETEDGE